MYSLPWSLSPHARSNWTKLTPLCRSNNSLGNILSVYSNMSDYLYSTTILTGSPKCFSANWAHKRSRADLICGDSTKWENLNTWGYSSFSKIKKNSHLNFLLNFQCGKSVSDLSLLFAIEERRSNSFSSKKCDLFLECLLSQLCLP